MGIPVPHGHVADADIPENRRSWARFEPQIAINSLQDRSKKLPWMVDPRLLREIRRLDIR